MGDEEDESIGAGSDDEMPPYDDATQQLIEGE